MSKISKLLKLVMWQSIHTKQTFSFISKIELCSFFEIVLVTLPIKMEVVLVQTLGGQNKILASILGGSKHTFLPFCKVKTPKFWGVKWPPWPLHNYLTANKSSKSHGCNKKVPRSEKYFNLHARKQGLVQNSNVGLVCL